MTQQKPELPFLPPEQVEPRIAAVLAADERVHWQGGLKKQSLLKSLLPIGIGALLLLLAFEYGWINFDTTELENLPAPWPVIVGIFAILFFLPSLASRQHWDYALTNQRIMTLRNGSIWQVATPEKMNLVGARRPGRVLWRNVDEVNTGSKWRRAGFWHQDDAQALAEMIQAWQDLANARGMAAAQDYRQAVDVIREQTQTQHPSSDTPAAGIERIINRELGFRIDAPAGWDKLVESRYDGPLRVFGVTLLPRIIRPGTPKPYDAQHQLGWNSLTLRGGPSVGLNISVQRGDTIRTLESVENDVWGTVLGVKAGMIEADVRIAGFTGFAVSRNMPNGGNLTGFGPVAVPIVTRQWWLKGHGLVFEIQGIAPSDAPMLQETVDMIVKSIANV